MGWLLWRMEFYSVYELSYTSTRSFSSAIFGTHYPPAPTDTLMSLL